MTENTGGRREEVRISGRPDYRIRPHTADTRIEVRGGSLTELCANAAYAMFDLMADLAALEPVSQLEVKVEAADPARLLVGLLEELLAVTEIAGVVPCRFHATGASPSHVEMAVEVVPASQVELRGAPIKAVTYHGLDVSRSGGTWRAQIVFDV